MKIFKQNLVEETTLTNEEEIIQTNLQKLHIQRKIWRCHNKNAICWVFFCVNNDKEVDAENLEIMRCLFCYISLLHASNPKTIERKVLIYITYGITTLKKHVDSNHVLIIKNFEEVNGPIRVTLERPQ
jgi:hypothetical protein